MSGVATDDVQRVHDDALGLFDACAGGSAQPDAQQRRVGIREQFGSHARQEKIQESDRGDEVDNRQRPAESQHAIQVAFVKRAEMPEDSFAFLAAMRFPHQPG